MAACAEELRAFDSRIPTPQIQSLKSMQRHNPQILLMEAGGVLFGIFGLVAEFLSFLGIYGLKAYEVTRRTAEIGIRMALGAQTGDVLRLVVNQGMKPVVIGLAIGVVAAFALGRLIATQLYQVSSYNPALLAGATLLLATTALAACLLPARRAVLVDPVEALRTE